MPRNFTHWAVVCAMIAVVLTATTGAWAQDTTPSIYAYYRETGNRLSVAKVTSRTTLEGPLARMHLQYVMPNTSDKRTEVCFNLHLPQDTLLTGFGYYYQGRFIKGKMYDRQEAWKIYQAVTSRGRDPGVMDRDTERDYHTQIFPVEPKQNLTVEIDLIQVLNANASGFFIEVPLVMPDRTTPIQIEARVSGYPAEVRSVTTNYPEATISKTNGTVTATLTGMIAPQRNWILAYPRPSSGAVTMVYSGLTGHREGYYLLFIAPGKALGASHARIINRIGTNLSMPTAFRATPSSARLFITGRYMKAGPTSVVLRDTAGKSVSVTANLSGNVQQNNLAAPLWADKRISQLQTNYRKDWRPEIIKLSKRHTVISRYTALLAIPEEELARYKEMLAQNNISTNTNSMGGGGGDPWISVKAPADAARVVAVFPTGEAKSLTYNANTGRWSGRFDFPFGTAPGRYAVTIIVVHRDGTRTHFLLEYQNLLHSAATANATSLRAARGETVTVRVQGSGIARAVALAPWGERTTLASQGTGWQGAITVPAGWSTGESKVTVILLDGAHNRTEITLDLVVE